MKVDTQPFPVSMVECIYPGENQPKFSFEINMAGSVYYRGEKKEKADQTPSKDKAEGDHMRGKDKEQADPRDRQRHVDKRYISEEQVRSVRYQKPLSTHLLNKYER
jgi:hypothetical protein